MLKLLILPLLLLFADGALGTSCNALTMTRCLISGSPSIVCYMGHNCLGCRTCMDGCMKGTGSNTSVIEACVAECKCGSQRQKQQSNSALEKPSPKYGCNERLLATCLLYNNNHDFCFDDKHCSDRCKTCFWETFKSWGSIWDELEVYEIVGQCLCGAYKRQKQQSNSALEKPRPKSGCNERQLTTCLMANHNHDFCFDDKHCSDGCKTCFWDTFEAWGSNWNKWDVLDIVRKCRCGACKRQKQQSNSALEKPRPKSGCNERQLTTCLMANHDHDFCFTDKQCSDRCKTCFWDTFEDYGSNWDEWDVEDVVGQCLCSAYKSQKQQLTYALEKSTPKTGCNERQLTTCLMANHDHDFCFDDGKCSERCKTCFWETFEDWGSYWNELDVLYLVYQCLCDDIKSQKQQLTYALEKPTQSFALEKSTPKWPGCNEGQLTTCLMANHDHDFCFNYVECSDGCKNCFWNIFSDYGSIWVEEDVALIVGQCLCGDYKSQKQDLAYALKKLILPYALEKSKPKWPGCNEGQLTTCLMANHDHDFCFTDKHCSNRCKTCFWNTFSDYGSIWVEEDVSLIVGQCLCGDYKSQKQDLAYTLEKLILSYALEKSKPKASCNERNLATCLMANHDHDFCFIFGDCSDRCKTCFWETFADFGSIWVESDVLLIVGQCLCSAYKSQKQQLTYASEKPTQSFALEKTTPKWPGCNERELTTCLMANHNHDFCFNYVECSNGCKNCFWETFSNYGSIWVEEDVALIVGQCLCGDYKSQKQQLTYALEKPTQSFASRKSRSRQYSPGCNEWQLANCLMAKHNKHYCFTYLQCSDRCKNCFWDTFADYASIWVKRDVLQIVGECLCDDY